VGPQGAGKGTQAKRVSVEYGVPHVSTGDLFRSAIAHATELGQKVKPFLDAGRLVPDLITVALIREQLEGRDGFILDGFPRNVAQAEALDEMLEAIGRPLDVVVLLELDDATARERMLRRAEIEGRPDDTPEVIDNRLATYHEETKPVIDHYLPTGRVVKIHGDRTIDEVWREIQDALEQTRQRKEAAA
jgi:adenylate kinase